MLTTVTFNEEEGGGTRITLEWESTDDWTQEELDTFIKGKQSMTQGWSGSFDKIEDYLDKKHRLINEYKDIPT